MILTDTFRRQHQEILDLVAQITALLQKKNSEIKEIGTLLPQIAGKLSVHLAMEDNVLYPKLFKSVDSKIRVLASEYSAEMGDLKKTFGEYIQNWTDERKIEQQFEEFHHATTGILAALQQRIERENHDLYQLIG